MDDFTKTLQASLGSAGIPYGQEKTSNVVPQQFGERNPDPLTSGATFGTEVPLEFATETFTIFRPWNGCARCLSALESGEIQLPEDGDWRCPHTQEAEYMALVNQMLSGKILLLSRETYSHQETCTQYVRVEWAVKDETAVRRLESKKKRASDEA